VSAVAGHGDPELLQILPATTTADRVALVGMHDWTDPSGRPSPATGACRCSAPTSCDRPAPPVLEWLTATGATKGRHPLRRRHHRRQRDPARPRCRHRRPEQCRSASPSPTSTPAPMSSASPPPNTSPARSPTFRAPRRIPPRLITLGGVQPLLDGQSQSTVAVACVQHEGPPVHSPAPAQRSRMAPLAPIGILLALPLGHSSQVVTNSRLAWMCTASYPSGPVMNA
jgi:hypothetical protein